MPHPKHPRGRWGYGLLLARHAVPIPIPVTTTAQQSASCSHRAVFGAYGAPGPPGEQDLERLRLMTRLRACLTRAASTARSPAASSAASATAGAESVAVAVQQIVSLLAAAAALAPAAGVSVRTALAPMTMPSTTRSPWTYTTHPRVSRGRAGLRVGVNECPGNAQHDLRLRQCIFWLLVSGPTATPTAIAGRFEEVP